MYSFGDSFESYHSTNTTPFIVIGVILAIALTVVLGIFVLPEKRRAQLGGFLRTVADIFNFKGLIIEKILKYLYIFFTFFFFILGFFMLFWQSFGRSMALQGLLMMVISPFVVRILFESMMLFILLAKNVIEINKKLGGASNNSPTYTEAPRAEPVQPKVIFCPHCGAQYDAAQGGFCPNCGKQP